VVYVSIFIFKNSIISEKASRSVTSSNGKERPVHILEVIGNASFGGMERYVTNFLSHLPSAEFRVAV
jgi:hypothetical protein